MITLSQRMNESVDIHNESKKGVTTFKSASGKKAVNISTDNGHDTPIYRAMYVQINNGDEQVLNSKSFKTMKGAEKWAKKELGLN